MPAINVELSDDELQYVRDQAGEAGMSIRKWAHFALLAERDDKAEIRAVAARVADWSAELNRRLA